MSKERMLARQLTKVDPPRDVSDALSSLDLRKLIQEILSINEPQQAYGRPHPIRLPGGDLLFGDPAISEAVVSALNAVAINPEYTSPVAKHGLLTLLREANRCDLLYPVVKGGSFLQSDWTQVASACPEDALKATPEGRRLKPVTTYAQTRYGNYIDDVFTTSRLVRPDMISFNPFELLLPKVVTHETLWTMDVPAIHAPGQLSGLMALPGVSSTVLQATNEEIEAVLAATGAEKSQLKFLGPLNSFDAINASYGNSSPQSDFPAHLARVAYIGVGNALMMPHVSLSHINSYMLYCACVSRNKFLGDAMSAGGPANPAIPFYLTLEFFQMPTMHLVSNWVALHNSKSHPFDFSRHIDPNLLINVRAKRISSGVAGVVSTETLPSAGQTSLVERERVLETLIFISDQAEKEAGGKISSKAIREFIEENDFSVAFPRNFNQFCEANPDALTLSISEKTDFFVSEPISRCSSPFVNDLIVKKNAERFDALSDLSKRLTKAVEALNKRRGSGKKDIEGFQQAEENPTINTP